MFFKIGVIKSFVNFTAKRLCWSHFLIKLQALRSATLFKKNSNTDIFLWNLPIFFLQNTSDGCLWKWCTWLTIFWQFSTISDNFLLRLSSLQSKKGEFFKKLVFRIPYVVLKKGNEISNLNFLPEQSYIKSLCYFITKKSVILQHISWEQDNCPPDNCHLGQLPPGQLPPSQFPPRKIPPR